MRADPRIVVGDIAQIVADDDGTDATCRVTAITLDAATGLATVEAAALTGRVAGYPLTH